MNQTKEQTIYDEDRILTIPNAMSLFRIVLIPVIVWLYIGKKQYLYAFLGLLLSGATDLLDGWVARKFHMVSKLGKVLDPIADKLTQVSLLICIMMEHSRVTILVVLMFIKEFIMAVTGLKVVKKTGEPYSAKWHGKVNTFLLDFTVILHVLWREIPEWLSTALTVICTGFMLFSLAEYWKQNRKLSRD
ncbi:MAG: CDP-alcohol phosphatidyltransferase family protein [Lachnospiraceae bacterium]|nr:CDP-alcohol phosphatidyltransferase family protein [Lachnospiraceae bacterium]